MNKNKISAGSFDLNKFLFGGYETDIITTIYGDAGSGKTNLCMILASSQAKKGNKVLFIDTEGGFSIERFKQLTGESYESYLKNILLLKPTSFKEQIKIFQTLEKQISNISLVIVDGMTMLYRLELSESREDIIKVKEINKELAKQMRILAEIARTKNIPVIITNQTYKEFLSKENFERGFTPDSFMVGGDILKYWSKCLIEIKMEKGKRKLILKKHRSQPQKELSFYITNSGIKRRGWI